MIFHSILWQLFSWLINCLWNVRKLQHLKIGLPMTFALQIYLHITQDDKLMFPYEGLKIGLLPATYSTQKKSCTTCATACHGINANFKTGFNNFQAFTEQSPTHPCLAQWHNACRNLSKGVWLDRWENRNFFFQSSCFSFLIFPLWRSISRCRRSISFLWWSISSWWCCFNAASCSCSLRLMCRWTGREGTENGQRDTNRDKLGHYE